MAGYHHCISLALLCLLLCQDSLATEPYKSTACEAYSSSGPFGPHAVFLMDHFLPDGAPNTADESAWNEYLGTYDHMIRNFQSYLMPNDLNHVMDVCKNSGGRQFTGKSNRFGSNGRTDLCISKRPFKFLTVHKVDNRWVPRVIAEERNLILGCAKVQNGCKPVHFERNNCDAKPNDEDKGCEGGPP